MPGSFQHGNIRLSRHMVLADYSRNTEKLPSVITVTFGFKSWLAALCDSLNNLLEEKQRKINKVSELLKEVSVILFYLLFLFIFAEIILDLKKYTKN